MTTRLYSAASSRTWSVTGALVDGLGLDPQRRAGAGHAGADPGAVAGAQHRGRRAAGQPADLLDRGDDAVGRVAVGEPRGQQQPLVGTGLGGVDDGRASPSSSTGTTMPGSTTRSGTERSGRRHDVDMEILDP